MCELSGSQLGHVMRKLHEIRGVSLQALRMVEDKRANSTELYDIASQIKRGDEHEQRFELVKGECSRYESMLDRGWGSGAKVCVSTAVQIAEDPNITTSQTTTFMTLQHHKIPLCTHHLARHHISNPPFALCRVTNHHIATTNHIKFHHTPPRQT